MTLRLFVATGRSVEHIFHFESMKGWLLDRERIAALMSETLSSAVLLDNHLIKRRWEHAGLLSGCMIEDRRVDFDGAERREGVQ